MADVHPSKKVHRAANALSRWSELSLLPTLTTRSGGQVAAGGFWPYFILFFTSGSSASRGAQCPPLGHGCQEDPEHKPCSPVCFPQGPWRERWCGLQQPPPKPASPAPPWDSRFFSLQVPVQRSRPDEHYLGSPTDLFLDANGFAWQLLEVAFGPLDWQGVRGDPSFPFAAEMMGYRGECQASSQRPGPQPHLAVQSLHDPQLMIHS